MELGKKFLKVEQVAEKLQINKQTVTKYIKNGKLGAIKLKKGYRIPLEDMMRFINENKTS
jgi:excisionase family DNA binding protein